MTPGRIAIGLLGAIIAAGARGAVRLSVALALSVAMLTACSTTTEVRQAKAEPTDYERAYADGWADREETLRAEIETQVRADERARIVAALDRAVTPHAKPRPDTSESWLNDYGAISLLRMARAREREMQLKLQCAAQFDALADAYTRAVDDLR